MLIGQGYILPRNFSIKIAKDPTLNDTAISPYRSTSARGVNDPRVISEKDFFCDHAITVAVGLCKWAFIQHQSVGTVDVRYGISHLSPFSSLSSF